jgi:hypothetical protein
MSAYSEEPEKESPTFYVESKLGLNFVAIALSPLGTSDNRLAILGGAKSDYFLSEVWGFFAGFEVTTRGAKLVSGDAARASFVDLPFGLTLRHRLPLIEGDYVSLSHLGAYYSIPLGHLKTDTLTVQDTRQSWGGYVNFATIFCLSESMSLGFDLWGKWGFTETYQRSLFGNLTTIVEAGAGLVWALH